MKTPKNNVLLLGMVFSEEFEPKRGQEFRDRVRCEAMENIGYEVKTLDTKHADNVISKHVQADFTEPRRMLRSIKSKWQDCVFDDIILDYFFSPVGWARERWTDGLYSKTIPEIAKQAVLKEGGKIWLPNLNCIKESLEYFIDVITEYYDIDLVSDPKLNPLYLATEDVEEELMKCPDTLTNETQLRPILEHSEKPFYVLTLKRHSKIVSPASNSKKRKTENVISPNNVKKEKSVIITPVKKAVVV